MSKIIGVTVGTTISPKRIEDKIKPVKTVNNQEPDENGNVEVIGNNGKDGVDGVSPTVTTSKSGKVTTIKITDKSGTKTATINDGADGANGEDGQRGTGIIKVTTGPSSYTTTVGGFTPTHRIALSTVRSESGVDKVLIGDTLAYSYYQFLVGYIDTSYVYLGGRASLRGATGADGEDGTSVTITKITESSVSGGTNTVTFSDGKTLSIKNGKDGKDGEGGSGGIGNDPIVIGDSDGQHTKVDIGSITLAEGEEYQVNLIGSTTDDLDECLLLEGKSGNDVQLRGLLAPTANNDAATKAYVDGKATKSGVGLSNVDNVKQYSASNPPPYPVTSVNGKTGAVTVTVPSKVSQLTNDSNFISSIPSEYVTETELEAKGYLTAVPSEYVTETELAAKKYLTSYTETDPTVPSWAKAASKPTYSKSEVGLGNVENVKQYSASNPPPYPVTSVNGKTGAVTVTVPTKVSELTNDSKYLTSYTETDPTVPSWAKATSKPTYTKSEVGLGNVDNVKQYSASNPPPYPVTSVNGKTGAVTVSVPTKTSELTNDSGFIRTSEAPTITLKGVDKSGVTHTWNIWGS